MSSRTCGSPRLVAFIACSLLLLSRVASAQAASVTTDKTDYVPGETVVITGTGWAPGETVSMVLYETPATHADRTLLSVADGNGNFTNSEYHPEPHDVSVVFTLTAVGLTSGRTASTSFADAASNLDQGANGKLTGTFTPDTVTWQNGDLNANNSHLVEGLSVPYRTVITDLTIGAHTMTIEWDIRQGGKNCLDYITNVSRLEPHNQ